MSANNPLPEDVPPGAPVPRKEEEGDALKRERAFLAPRFATLQPREAPPAVPPGSLPPGVGPGGHPDDPFGRAQAFAAPRAAVLQPRTSPPPAPPAGPGTGEQPRDPDFRLRLIREYRRRHRRVLPGPSDIVPFEPPAPPPANNWIPIGPSGVRQGQASNRPVVSGRCTGIAVAPGGKLVYAATANGGVWRSDDGGMSWRSLMDAFDLKPTTLASDSLSCGAIALDPTNPRRVFVGSGEGDGAAYFGVGPIVSTDGGDNWVTEPVAAGHPPLAGSAFYALAVDPANPDRVVAGTRQGAYRREPDGAGGFLWARKEMGQVTWVTSVVAASCGGATTFYGARWFGPVFASTDGAAWAVAGTDFPGGDVGRIGLAVQPDNPALVYALVTRSSGAMLGVWRLDSDSRWRPVSGTPLDLFGAARFQGAYDLAIAVDPEDADLIYLGGSTRLAGGQWSGALYRCRVQADGSGDSRTYQTTPEYIGGNVHADIHTLRFTPGDRHSLWVGCDGGIFQSSDADTGATFESRNAGLASLTMNHLGLHPNEDAVLFCGTQDNGTTRYTGEEVWLHSAAGDGGYALVHWGDPLKVLRTYIQGILERTSDGGQGYASWGDVSLPKAYLEQALFYAPLAGTPRNDASPGDADVIAFGGQRPWLSTTFGGNWTSLPNNADSDDLPTPISALAFASATRLYAGTTVSQPGPSATGGNVYRFDRSGATWTRTQIDAPPLLRGPVTSITIDPADPSGKSIYLTLGGGGDYRHVWHYDGASWEARSGPADNPDGRLLDVQHNALTVDPDQPNRLFVGADIGAWRSPGGGATWLRFSDGLPDAAVLDMKFHPRRRLLLVATHGRGAYEYNVDADSALGVELFARHTQLDRGRRATDDGLPDPTQPGAEVSHRRGPDVKVDPPGAGGAYQTPTNQINFCQFVDTILDGSDRVLTADPGGDPAVNRVYVQVHNRGVLPANGVRVLLLLARGGDTLPDLPPGYDAQVRAGQAIASEAWRTVGQATVNDVRVGLPRVAAFDLPSALLPPPAALPGQDTFCLVALLHSDDDPFTNSQLGVDALTLSERKAVQKTIRVVAAVAV